MVLEILLTTLIVCFISGGILVYLWWKKYGKKIFGLMDSVSKLKNGLPELSIPKIENKNNVQNLNENLARLKDLMNSLNNVQNNIKSRK